MKAITPKEAMSKVGVIPDFVIAGFNRLIAEQVDSCGEVRIRPDEAVREIMRGAPEGFNKQDLYDKGMMDVEPIFRKAGWYVKYSKADWGEDNAMYYFRATRKSLKHEN